MFLIKKRTDCVKINLIYSAICKVEGRLNPIDRGRPCVNDSLEQWLIDIAGVPLAIHR